MIQQANQLIKRSKGNIKPLDQLFRGFVHSAFDRIPANLKIIEQFAGGSTHELGTGDVQSVMIEIKVNSLNFYRRAVLGGNIGAAESYIDGEWDSPHLTQLVEQLSRHKNAVDKIDGPFAWASKIGASLAHQFRHNDIKNARANIMAHYDVGNAMYEQFLDHTLMYSSAIYPSDEATLEEAQQNKLKVICDKLQLKPNDHVIEIGTGWGGFAIFAATHYGCHITTTTISEAQYAEATKRVNAAGLQDKITLLKEDYRNLKGSFDKLVSIEMIEAVGHEYLPVFFSKCSRLLKPGGAMLIQAITYRDQDYSDYLKSADFIQKHIFPGGCLLSSSDLLQRYQNHTDMSVNQLEEFGLHYARTLKDWGERFEAASDTLSTLGYDERFKRLWRYYFKYCEGGFLSRRIGVVQILSSKPEAVLDFALHGQINAEMHPV